MHYWNRSVTNNFLNIPLCISNLLESFLDNCRGSKDRENTSNSQRMQLYSTPCYWHGSHIYQIYLVTPLHSFGDYRRKWWLVTEYWINCEMVFFTVQPFWDSFNTYASVESLDSRLYLSRTFTFVRMIKEWNYLINFTHLKYFFWFSSSVVTTRSFSQPYAG